MLSYENKSVNAINGMQRRMYGKVKYVKIRIQSSEILPDGWAKKFAEITMELEYFLDAGNE